LTWWFLFMQRNFVEDWFSFIFLRLTCSFLVQSFL
jgi:hypothetical protein